MALISMTCTCISRPTIPPKFCTQTSRGLLIFNSLDSNPPHPSLLTWSHQQPIERSPCAVLFISVPFSKSHHHVTVCQRCDQRSYSSLLTSLQRLFAMLNIKSMCLNRAPKDLWDTSGFCNCSRLIFISPFHPLSPPLNFMLN